MTDKEEKESMKKMFIGAGFLQFWSNLWDCEECSFQYCLRDMEKKQHRASIKLPDVELSEEEKFWDKEQKRWAQWLNETIFQ